MNKKITSPHNPLIKQIVSLTEKSRERRKMGLFVIEGLREILLAIKGNYQLKTIIFCSEIIPEEEILRLKESTNSKTEFIEITSEIYEKLAYRSSTEGVMAIAETKDLDISKLQISPNRDEEKPHSRTIDWFPSRERGSQSGERGRSPSGERGRSPSGERGRSPSGVEGRPPLILIAEAPEKPGNIGALLRTADAAHVDLVIIANPKTDIYNPNIIRSSVGCVFTNNVATGITSEIISFLKDNSINIYCAALQASVPYYTCDFKESTAIVVGTEAIGLSEEWLENSTQNIIIPMQGEIDSMNVSVAAGILIFEAKRQRGF